MTPKSIEHREREREREREKGKAEKGSRLYTSLRCVSSAHLTGIVAVAPKLGKLCQSPLKYSTRMTLVPNVLIFFNIIPNAFN